MLGRGAFLLYPRTEGLDEEFEDGKHYVSFERGNHEQLSELIRWYAEHDHEREQIRLLGFRHVKANLTYTHRCKELLSVVNETLALRSTRGETAPPPEVDRNGQV